MKSKKIERKHKNSRGSEEIQENCGEFGKIRENTEDKIRKHSKKDDKSQENRREFGKIRGNMEEYEKIQKNTKESLQI